MVWQYRGFTGEPGYCRFNFQELVDPTAVQAAHSGIRQFFIGISSLVKTTWTFTPPSVCQHYDVTTGDLNQEVTIPTPGAAQPGTGLATSTYSGGTGAVVQWQTGAVLNGRKVRGRTFLVPLILSFESDGTLIASVITTITAAATTFRTTSGYTFAIYHRGPEAGGTGPVGSSAIVPVIGNTVPDRSAILRSRRT